MSFSYLVTIMTFTLLLILYFNHYLIFLAKLIYLTLILSLDFDIISLYLLLSNNMHHCLNILLIDKLFFSLMIFVTHLLISLLFLICILNLFQLLILCSTIMILFMVILGLLLID